MNIRGFEGLELELYPHVNVPYLFLLKDRRLYSGIKRASDGRFIILGDNQEIHLVNPVAVYTPLRVSKRMARKINLENMRGYEDE